MYFIFLQQSAPSSETTVFTFDISPIDLYHNT